MAQKCTHKGCEKEFTVVDEPCVYHPGAPIFHEGQKGWQCCKPRVLTFDEFLTIPPCTTGNHSTTAPTLAPVQTSGPNSGIGGDRSQKHTHVVPPSKDVYGREVYGRDSPKPLPRVTPSATPPPPKVERPLEQDPEGVSITEGTKCKRLACTAVYTTGCARSDQECTFHPGSPIFHEGSKGYSCCKRRVLEFDQFLNILGCTKNKHLFLGAPTSNPPSDESEEEITCRNDFYQTYTNVIVSIFAKKVDKQNAKITFLERELSVDLPMADKKRFRIGYPLYAAIDPDACTFKIFGTKVEIQLKKADGTSWPTLRSDESTGEIIQIGKPATA